MITCVQALQSVDLESSVMRNVLVLRNASGEELELAVAGADLQRVMTLLQKEMEPPSDAPSLSEEEIRIIEEHRRRPGPVSVPSPANTEDLADRLMRGEDVADALYDEDDQALSTPFRG